MLKLNSKEQDELSFCSHIISGKEITLYTFNRNETLKFIDKIFTTELPKIWISSRIISFDLLNNLYKRLCGKDHVNYTEIANMAFLG